MNGNGSRIERIAEQISDGAAVDWHNAESTVASEEEMRVLENLRIIEEISNSIRTPKDVEVRLPPAEASAALTLTDAKITKAFQVDDRPSWGPFELLERIGSGAFGDVYRARDTHLDCLVALKLLREEESAKESVASEVIREGRLMARVQHSNIVAIRGADRHDGRVGIWMEYVEGRTLGEIVRGGQRYSAGQASGIGMDLCRALAAVHKADLVHSDVKAENVMQDRDGRIRLMDFSAGRDLRDTVGEKDQRVSGTPLYMAPEILLTRQSSKRSDIYALGVLLYHLVTGKYPVTADTLSKLREAHKERRRRPLGDERPDLDPAFIDVVEKALDWDPEKRYQTAGEMERALRSVAYRDEDRQTAASVGEGEGTKTDDSRPRVRRWLAAAAAVVFVGVAIWVLFPRPPEGDGAPDGSVSEGSGGGGKAPVLPPQVVPAGRKLACDAFLVRRTMTGEYAPLRDGDRVRLYDELSMRMECSTQVHAYVISEDERGEGYLHFPLRASGLANPLPPGQEHVLPGHLRGREDDPSGRLNWIVTSEGGREHFLIVLSRERLPELEADLEDVPEPRLLGSGSPADQAVPPPPSPPDGTTGTTYAQLSEASKSRLRGIFRGIGGVATEESRPLEATTPGAARVRPDGAETLFQIYDRHARPHEGEGGDIWARHIVLENPVTSRHTGG